MNMQFLQIYTQMKIPSHVTHECTVQACASLGTRYMPASTSDTQVKRVTRKHVHVSVLAPYGILVASITASLVYLFVITYHAFR